MNVFGVGPLELIVILVVMLIFVGPERLPRMAADLARTIREIRKYTASFAAEFNDVIKEFEKETEAERTEWKEIGEGLGAATADANRQLAAASKELDAASRDASASDTSALPPPANPSTSAANGVTNGTQPATTDAKPVEKAP